MSLGHRLLVSLAGWAAAYLAVLAFVHEVVLMGSFDALEQREAEQDTRRVTEALSGEVAHLATLARNWAVWDDAYTFVVDVDQAFVDSNMTPTAIETTELAGIYFVDRDNRVVWGRLLSEMQRPGSASGTPACISELHAMCMATLSDDGLAARGVGGIVSSELGVMLAAAEPIFDSQHTQECRGTMVMLRDLDEARLALLRSKTRVDFDLRPALLGEARTSADSLAALARRGPTDWQPEAGMLVGSTQFADYLGQPAFDVLVRVPRHIHGEGRRALALTLAATITGGLLMLVLVYLRLQRQVVRPLVTLAAESVQVGISDGRATITPLERDDEIGTLARGMGWMTEQLAESRGELVKASRNAGRAEVAASVLHNVGNVLNAISVAAALLEERVETTQVPGTLRQLSDLLSEQGAELARWVEHDPRGGALAAFVGEVASQARSDVELLGADARTLRSHVEHVRAVLRRHQGIARANELAEPTTLDELAQQAIDLARVPRGLGAPEIVYDIAAAPRLDGPKHRILEVLVNLVNNAWDALESHATRAPRITLRASLDTAGRACFEVEDNGPGIPTELATKVFQMGFTTKAEGSGIGLHASANTAAALGGSLRLRPYAPGSGACFRLEVPVETHTAPNAAPARAAA